MCTILSASIVGITSNFSHFAIDAVPLFLCNDIGVANVTSLSFSLSNKTRPLADTAPIIRKQTATKTF
jgi:hypothetical protein